MREMPAPIRWRDVRLVEHALLVPGVGVGVGGPTLG